MQYGIEGQNSKKWASAQRLPYNTVSCKTRQHLLAELQAGQRPLMATRCDLPHLSLKVLDATGMNQTFQIANSSSAQ